MSIPTLPQQKYIMKSYLYSVLGAILMMSCQTSSFNEIVITGYDDSVKENPVEAIKKIDVTPLSLKTGEFISSPVKVEMTDEYIFLLDNNKLLEFNHEGKFLRQIGQSGHGHGEYLNVVTFAINNGVIYIIDCSRNSALLYSTDGTFIKELKAPEDGLCNAKNILFDNDHDMIISNHVYNDFNDILTKWNIKTNELYTLSNVPMKSAGTREFIGKHPVVKHDTDIMYICPFSNTLCSLAGPSLVFQSDKDIVPQTKLSSIKDFSIMTYAEFDTFFHGFTDIFETENSIILSYFENEYTIVNKDDWTCKTYSMAQEWDCLFPFYKIMNTYNNKFISIVSPEELTNIIENTAEFDEKDNLKILQERNSENYFLIEIEI